MQLRGTRTLLTGASSGVGYHLALGLAQRGARLALAARRSTLLDELGEKIAATGAERPTLLSADLSQRGTAAQLAEEARSRLGGVDLLINNAASNLHGCPSAVGDRDEARELFELNVWSPLALVRELVPEMQARGDGMVVNVTSLAVVAPFPAVGHYCASKAALSLATRSLDLEMRPTGVRVLEVLLGVLDTEGSRANRAIAGADRWLDAAKPGKPEKAAQAITRAIERDRSRLIYPRRMSPAHELPLLGRIYARSVLRGFDPSQVTVKRTGWQPESEARTGAGDDAQMGAGA